MIVYPLVEKKGGTFGKGKQNFTGKIGKKDERRIQKGGGG